MANGEAARANGYSLFAIRDSPFTIRARPAADMELVDRRKVVDRGALGIDLRPL